MDESGGLESSYGSSALDVTERGVGQAVVVTVAGEIDMVTAPRLQDAVDRVLESPPATLIVDLARVVFLASAGLRLLVNVDQRAAECGVAMRVVAEGPHTAHILELMKLDTVLAVFADLQSALEAD